MHIQRFFFPSLFVQNCQLPFLLSLANQRATLNSIKGRGDAQSYLPLKNSSWVNWVLNAACSGHGVSIWEETWGQNWAGICISLLTPEPSPRCQSIRYIYCIEGPSPLPGAVGPLEFWFGLKYIMLGELLRESKVKEMGFTFHSKALRSMVTLISSWSKTHSHGLALSSTLYYCWSSKTFSSHLLPVPSRGMIILLDLLSPLSANTTCWTGKPAVTGTWVVRPSSEGRSQF